MLHDALANGPTWFSDYGLDGMQYGATQLFSAVKSYIKENPNAKLIVSPSGPTAPTLWRWFFFPDSQPFQLGSIERDIDTFANIDAQTEFV